jgi:2,4-dienoyl-CoA reductase (NADPH2)
MHERYLEYLKKQVHLHPEIEVHCKTPVTPELVAQVAPDRVVVANGGKVPDYQVPGVDGKNVVTSHDFLDMLNGDAPHKAGAYNSFMWHAASLFLKLYYTPGFARKATTSMNWPIGNPLAIIGGGMPGCELATLAMKTGRTVNIIEANKKIGFDVSPSEKFGMTTAFKQSPNVETYTLSKVLEITDQGVRFQQTPVGPDRQPLLDDQGKPQVVEHFVDARTVAVTLGFEPNTALADSLETVYDVALAGDCANPGRIADATKTGYQAVYGL